METITSFNSENKKQIARVIAHLFQGSEIPERITKSLITRLIWMATENDNEGKKQKYLGQPYWSEGAILQYNSNIKSGIVKTHNLRHEHSIPKKEILNKILKSDKTYSSVYQVLDHFAHSAILSTKEDEILTKKGLRSKMPYELANNSNARNIFSRYVISGVKVYFLENGNPTNYDSDRISTLKCLT